jgi:methionyl-tRNA formyltransferase
MKIGYFGDGPWAHQAFDLLLSDPAVEIAFVCPRFDSRDPVLIERAEKASVPVVIEKNVNTREAIERIGGFKCDLLVSMSFNQIFRQSMIELAPEGLINCHAGKLPFYRGRNVLNWVLINDERDFGITVHYVDQGIDTGDIILQRTFPITDNDDYGTLLDTAYKECARILHDSVRIVESGKAERLSQAAIHPVGMYCGRRQEGDEVLYWNQTSREVFNFVRAITDPGPVARSRVKGHEVRIRRVEMISEAPVYKGIPGQIVGKDQFGPIVKTADTVVRITSYLADADLKVGDRFE